MFPDVHVIKTLCEALSSSQGTLRGLRRSLGRILPKLPPYDPFMASEFHDGAMNP